MNTSTAPPLSSSPSPTWSRKLRPLRVAFSSISFICARLLWLMSAEWAIFALSRQIADRFGAEWAIFAFSRQIADRFDAEWAIFTLSRQIADRFDAEWAIFALSHHPIRSS